MNCRPVAGILGLVSNILILWALVSPRWSTSLPITTSGQPIRVGFLIFVHFKLKIWGSRTLTDWRTDGPILDHESLLKIENPSKYHRISGSVETVLWSRWHCWWLQHRMQQIYSGNRRISSIWVGGSTSLGLFVLYFLFLRSHFRDCFNRGCEFGQIKKVKK